MQAGINNAHIIMPPVWFFLLSREKNAIAAMQHRTPAISGHIQTFDIIIAASIPPESMPDIQSQYPLLMTKINPNVKTTGIMKRKINIKTG